MRESNSSFYKKLHNHWNNTWMKWNPKWFDSLDLYLALLLFRFNLHLALILLRLHLDSVSASRVSGLWPDNRRLKSWLQLHVLVHFTLKYVVHKGNVIHWTLYKPPTSEKLLSCNNIYSLIYLFYKLFCARMSQLLCVFCKVAEITV